MKTPKRDWLATLVELPILVLFKLIGWIGGKR